MSCNPEWITPTLAFLAFIVSVLSLWHTSVKGPDIVLCERPEFALKRIPRRDFDYFIPDTLSSEAHLTFLNKGTVSGVLRLDPRFEPAEELNPFFDKASFSFSINNASPGEIMPFISIREKESCVISLGLRIGFHDWKEHFAHEPVPKDEICNVLRQADYQNRRRFDDFRETLKLGMHIGKLSIKSSQTMRKNVFWTKMAERDLVDDQYVGVVDEELIGGFESCAKKWDTLKPDAILTELRQIHECFHNMLLNPIDQNIRKLTQPGDLTALETDILDDLRRRCEDQGNRIAIVDFILRSMHLDSVLREYDSRIRVWNRKLNLLQEDRSSKSLEEALRKEMASLERESKHIYSEISWVQKVLRDCYLPSS
jgi:hypothetical protein